MASVDLHTHSTASDGVLAPRELVAYAAVRGVRVLALTDHDTLDGLTEASAAAAELGIELIPGVELSCEAGSHQIHLLGYFADQDDALLRERLQILAQQRRERAERIVERLNAVGVPVSLERVRDLAGGGTMGRPHVARAMIESGHASSVQDAFARYLSHGCPAYVAKVEIAAEEAVATLRQANTVPVLAHPLSTGDVKGTIERLIPHGLLGIEVYYGEYDADAHDALRALADRYDLTPTGGSDFHGPNFKPGRELGAAPVPAECATRLRQKWESLAAKVPSHS